MPKSKRERKVTLSKTQKKGRERKASIIDEVREHCDKFTSVYAFDADNMRKVNELLADLVQQTDKQNRSRDDENALRFKSIDDWLCKLNFAVEVEKDQREKDVAAVQEELGDERREREEDEKNIIQLLETNMAKVYKGLEKCTNV